MENVQVHRYENEVAGWAGYVTPDSGKWILFVGTDGTAALFDPAIGQVIASL